MNQAHFAAALAVYGQPDIVSNSTTTDKGSTTVALKPSGYGTAIPMDSPKIPHTLVAHAKNKERA